MEKLLRPNDKEYMRMAMLKHEETFKQQVYELHRLYRIQKTLMRSMGTSGLINGSFSLKNNNNNNHANINSRASRLDMEHPAADDGDEEFIDESEIELTLGPTKYMSRKKHWTPQLTSDSGPNSFSSSSTESCHMNNSRPRTSMATKQKINATRDEFIGRDLRLLHVTDATMGYHGSKINVDIEEHLRQESLTQPPWFFQALSMNMT